MIWTIFELSVNFFEAALMVMFMKSRLHIRQENWIADCGCVAACGLFYSLYYFFDVPLNDILVFGFPFVYALIVASDPWQISLFWTIMLSLLFSSTVGAAAHVFMGALAVDFELLMVPGFLRLMFMLSANFALFFVIFLASQPHSDSLYMTWPARLTFLMISVSILATEECLYHLQITSEGSALLYCIANGGLLVCTVFSILLFRFMAESSLREHQYKSEIHTYMLTQKHREEFTDMYRDFISREHDFKHQLQTIEELIKQSGREAAGSYLEQYRSNLPNAQLFVTGCLDVDALLTAKYYTMKARQIEFHFTPYPLSALPLSVPDFCSIVGNLLDNAIEGSLRVDSPASALTISLTFARTYDVFHILCENPCNPRTIEKYRNQWISSKISERIPGTHGIGIFSIERIVNKAEGYCRFYVQDSVFFAELTIPYPECG